MSTYTRHLPLLLIGLAIACSDDAPADSNNKPAPDMTADMIGDMSADSAPDQPVTPEDMSNDMPEDMPSDMQSNPGCEVGAPAGAGQVATDKGLVQGVREGQAWAYKGIPYVAPPVGALRWRAPQPAACWTGTREANDHLAKCPQKNEMGATVGAEDCLGINVWTPDKPAPAGGWPVMFFIHGGGNIQGSGSEVLQGGKPFYDGARLSAAQDAVVITFNYRLGALGYLTTPQLDTESGAGAGNWGLLDQIEALRWTQRNIARFGGDAGRVMIFGESAGAVNVCALMTVDGVDGLFHSALMQSGGCFSTAQTTAQELSAELIADSPCKDATDKLACLRALPAAEVVDVLPASLDALSSTALAGGLRTFGPTHGADSLLKVQPLDAIEAGDFARVPFVVGTNLDEMQNLLALPPSLTAAQYEQSVRASFLPFGAATGTRVLELYPASAYPTPRDAAVQLYSDLRFTCPARVIVRAARAHQPEVWRYFFTRRATTPRGETPAFHAIELLYVFGSINNIPLYMPAEPDRALTSEIQRRWSALARTGTPDHDGAMVQWPAYEVAADSYLELGTTVRAGAGVNTEKCDYFEALVAGL
jgi:para-nitrobenzyl esterase